VNFFFSLHEYDGDGRVTIDQVQFLRLNYRYDLRSLRPQVFMSIYIHFLLWEILMSLFDLLMKNMVLTRRKSYRTFVKDDVAYLIRRNVSS